MPAPRTICMAGPSGGGKSSLFSIHDFDGVTAFSTDDRAAQLNAKFLGRPEPAYTGIPHALREQAGAELQRFIEDSIAANRSFASETTLREVAFEQARSARSNGFRVPSKRTARTYRVAERVPQSCRIARARSTTTTASAADC